MPALLNLRLFRIGVGIQQKVLSHVPTRLLDWTKSPYVAIYFAVTSALSNFDSSRKDAEIAVWVLNSKQAKDKKYSHLFRVVKTPGSVSRHLSAQSGLFTVHMHNGKRKGPYTVQGIEEMVDIDEQPILKKVTIPISQAFILYKFCKQIGINAATIFPSADGAGKAVRDDFNYRKASEQFLSI